MNRALASDPTYVLQTYATKVRPGQIGDCEASSADLLSQPVNAISSLAFVLVAIVLLFLLLRARHLTAWAWVYVVVLVCVGISSADFHGPASPIAQFTHDAAIVALLALATLVPIVRLVRREPALRGWSWGRLTVVVVVLALAAPTWILGRTHSSLCDPGSLLQWHAVWHILSAAAFGVWGLILFGASAVANPARQEEQPEQEQQSGG